MIRSLGAKKVLTLLSLALGLAFIYGYGTMVLGPKNEQTERKLRAQKSEISQVTQNMSDLRTGIEKFEVQKDKFENLQTLGFFDAQDRLAMRSKLNAIQAESGLLSAQYNINPAITDDNEKAREAGYKIFNTPISFSLSAISDAEIYKFIYLLNYGFPGQVNINKISISKTAEVTPTLLQKIGIGEPVPVISASLSINLRTLVEDLEAKRLREAQDEEQW